MSNNKSNLVKLVSNSIPDSCTTNKEKIMINAGDAVDNVLKSETKSYKVRTEAVYPDGTVLVSHFGRKKDNSLYMFINER